MILYVCVYVCVCGGGGGEGDLSLTKLCSKFIPYKHAGFSSVILSTIERRYQFSSTAAGLISSTYDMAVLVSVVFISYFGGKGHKPRWLGISLIIQGAGMLYNTQINKGLLMSEECMGYSKA